MKTINYWKRKEKTCKEASDYDEDKILIEIAACHPSKGTIPNPEFASRLDKAITLYHELKEQGKQVILYVPGSLHAVDTKKDGSGREWLSDTLPLAEIGKRYLVKKGIPEQDIRADESNRKFKKDGVYNSGDECFVATQIANEENCGRLMSLVSSVQIDRKALFYTEFGRHPEICSVPPPAQNPGHNYVGEIFFSLYMTYFEDHNWQNPRKIMSPQTRSERNPDFFPLTRGQRRILSKRLQLSRFASLQKQNWLEKYTKARENMLNTEADSIFIDIQKTEPAYLQQLEELLQEHQGKEIYIKSDDKKLSEIIPSSETLHISDQTPVNIQEFGKALCICSSPEAFKKAIDYIQNGIFPITYGIASQEDRYIDGIQSVFRTVLSDPHISLDDLKRGGPKKGPKRKNSFTRQRLPKIRFR